MFIFVYVDITWKELKPKGHYNWETIKKVTSLNDGRKKVSRSSYASLRLPRQIVIRISLTGLEINDLGDAYSTSYVVRDFLPNYQSKPLRKYYKDAVTAMGQRWGNDIYRLLSSLAA